MNCASCGVEIDADVAKESLAEESMISWAMMELRDLGDAVAAGSHDRTRRALIARDTERILRRLFRNGRLLERTELEPHLKKAPHPYFRKRRT